MHLLVSMGRTIAMADMVRVIKANSSGWMHDENGIPDFQWQNRALRPIRHYASRGMAGMAAGFWLGLQQDRDLWHAIHSDRVADIKRLAPLGQHR